MSEEYDPLHDVYKGGNRTVWGRFVMLWLSGICLRVTILAVPPLLPSIHRDLNLDEKLVAVVTVLPVLLLAGAAVLGSLLVARIGARRAIIAGLLLIAIAGGARGAGGTPLLLLMTFLMGVGISVSQPALPSLVRQWFPFQSGLATAVYSNGFLIGEIVAVAFTVPLVLPLTGHSWRLALLLWSVPVVLTADIVFLGSPHVIRGAGPVSIQWWPDWHSTRTWRLGLILGCASITYFGANAFIPDYLKAVHQGTYIPAALTGLNLGQLPASLLVAAMPSLFVRRKWPVVAAGALILLSGLGLFAPGPWVVVSAAILGFPTALVFVLSLALPPILADEHDVHRLSAAMFAITYACSFGCSLLAGALWDATGIPGLAFVPVIGAGPLMVLLVLQLNLGSTTYGLARAAD